MSPELFKVIYDPKSDVTLIYDQGSKLVGRYDMRGGVCWPMIVEESGGAKYEGYAVMCGQDISDGIIKVLDQLSFVTVDTIFSKDLEEIERPGLTTWLNDCRLKYRNDRYYWNQNRDLTQRFRLETARSKVLDVPIMFPETKWNNAEDVIHTILKKVEEGKLQVEAETPLADDLAYLSINAKTLSPAIHALGCAVASYERHPWRPRRQTPESVTRVVSPEVARVFPGLKMKRRSK